MKAVPTQDAGDLDCDVKGTRVCSLAALFDAMRKADACPQGPPDDPPKEVVESIVRIRKMFDCLFADDMVDLFGGKYDREQIVANLEKHHKVPYGFDYADDSLIHAHLDDYFPPNEEVTT